MRTRSIITAFALVLAGASVASAEIKHHQFGPDNRLVFVEGEPWAPEGIDQALILGAQPVETAPAIDGQANDPAWATAKELTVPLAHGSVGEATLKAVYTDKEVFLLVSWPDATKDDQHRPWVWSEKAGGYTEGPQVEDQLIVSFEAGCEWTPSMLSGYTYDFDAWRWLAARTDPIGQAVDAYGHTHANKLKGYKLYQARAEKPTWQMKFEGHDSGLLTKRWDELKRIYRFSPISADVWVSYAADGEQPPTSFARELPAPDAVTHNADASLGPKAAHASLPKEGKPAVAPRYEPIKLTGDAGEVTAKGSWANGRWTVEFRRVLETPARTATDHIFARTTQFSIHVFDHTERVDEASESGRLWLQFEPAEKTAANE